MISTGDADNNKIKRNIFFKGFIRLSESISFTERYRIFEFFGFESFKKNTSLIPSSLCAMFCRSILLNIHQAVDSFRLW